LDERDFAELISVFLKGNEPDKNPNKEESDGATNTGPSSSEAEVRKNIIEALAERIKESQEVEGTEGYPATESAEPSIEETTMQGKTGPGEAIPGEESFIEQEAEEEATAVESKGIEAFETRGPEEAGTEEQLITKEEVDQLLSKEEPAEIVTLQQILHRFTSLDGVIAALLVTRDGFIVDYASNIEFDLDMVSAVVATGFGTLDKIGYELEQGALQLAMLEYEQGPVVISPLVQDIALVVVASQWTTLGRIRWEIKKQSDELVANL